MPTTPPTARAHRPAAACRILPVLLFLLLPFPAFGAAQTAEGEGDTADPGTVERTAAGQAVGTPAAGTPEHLSQAPRAEVFRMQGEADVEVDGRLQEPVWRDAPAVTRFVQREPRQGEPATQRTEVRFAHDGHTLYVGARMYDDRGAEGVTGRLVRRDGDAQSDELVLTFDPFHDHVSQTRFSINPAGVRGDASGLGGGHPDPSWDPVWQSAARVDGEGWVAELAIPLSQLRFPRDTGAVWGLQITRTVSRLNEVSVWSFWSLDEQGGPSRFGHLEGMTGIEAAANRLELLPYTVGQVHSRGSIDSDNPFVSEAEADYRAGADLTYLITSNLTLNATFNPDFGQVEVDPAVVNLSAFETFFPEKREFFIEGQGRFGFGSFWCIFCNNASSLDMLFTRRIGRAPQGASLAEDAGEFADVPDATTILGAAKVTGQTSGGTSLGVLAAATGRERARVRGAGGERSTPEVEPFTGYLVSRVKQDFLDGDLQVGGIFTGVARDFADEALAERLNRHSEGVGVDAEYWWGDHTYHLLFSGAVTNISGEPEAIRRAQESSARYFQRPDRGHGGNGLFTDRYDPTLTSMRGWALYSRVAKDAGNWRWEGALNVRSPGFENNDIAFLTRTDYVWMNANVGYSWTEPTSWYREMFTAWGVQQQLNFDGDLTDRDYHGYLSFQTPFYWNVSTFFIRWLERDSDRLTRGGPVVRTPAETYLSASVSTDSRKAIIAGLSPNYAWDAEGGSQLRLPLDLTFKPRSNLSFTLSPTYSRSTSTEQYVTSVEDPTADEFYGRRYVFADLDQESLSMTTRLNWTFSPGMSLEAFVQPLISANDFGAFKEFAAPRGLAKEVYGRDVGTLTAEGDPGERSYVVDPDAAGPADPFTFEDPDFNFRSLRGNLVFRWEWRPGSTLYLVWTQDRSSSGPFGDFAFDRDTDALFGTPADDIFLVKATWWLGL